MSVASRVLRVSVVAVLATVGIPAMTAAPAAAGPVEKIAANPGHAVFLVKDLGGGAYWNVTTSSLYVVESGSAAAVDAIVTAATTGAELVATTADAGRGALLLVNGTVIVPAQEALGL
jgi:hypothetical protein